MINPQDLQKENEALCLLAGEKFSFRADTLDKALRKVGRRLPKRVRRNAAVLVQAEAQSGHPKLARMVDSQAVAKAQRDLRQALEQIDPKQRRKNAILDLLSSLAFRLLLVAAFIILFLRWRGLV